MAMLARVLAFGFYVVVVNSRHDHHDRPQDLQHKDFKGPFMPLNEFFHELFKPPGPNTIDYDPNEAILLYNPYLGHIGYNREHKREEEIKDKKESVEALESNADIEVKTETAAGNKERKQEDMVDKSERDVKLSKVIPADNEKDPHPIIFPEPEEEKADNTTVNKTDSKDSDNNKQEAGLSKNTDYILVPVATAINPSLSFAQYPNGASNMQMNPANFNLAMNGIQNPPVAGNGMQNIASLSNRNGGNSNSLQGPVNQPNYQYTSTPQNQLNVVPINKLQNTGNQPNLYTMVNVPNNFAYQGVNNGVPNQNYLANNPMQNNAGLNNNPGYNLVTLNNQNIPNNMVYLNNQQNIPNNVVTLNNQPSIPNNLVTVSQPNNQMMAWNAQPNNLFLLNNGQNVPSNMNQPGNTGAMNVIALNNQPNSNWNTPWNNQPNNQATYGNQPNNLVTMNNQPNNLMSLNNSPNNLVAYTNQPNNLVTMSNQPNNLVTLSNPSNNLVTNQPNNLVAFGNQPNNLVTVTNQPNNLVAFGNQPNNLVTFSNQPNNLVTVTNQPNNFVTLGNQPNNVVTLSNQPNNVVAYGNQPNGNIPLLWQQTNNGNNVPLYSMKDTNDGQNGATETVKN